MAAQSQPIHGMVTPSIGPGGPADQASDRFPGEAVGYPEKSGFSHKGTQIAAWSIGINRGKVPGVSDREERVARNEAVIREINEEIEDALGLEARKGHVPMLCECGRSECEDVLPITIREYEEVRSDPRRFAVVREHVMADIEAIVSETDRFVVVQKREGAPARSAEALDPRS